MPELPRVVANNTPYIEDRGIWRITVTGSYETNCSHYFGVTLDTDNDLNYMTALNWIHSQCRKQFVAGTELFVTILAKNLHYERSLIVQE